MDEYCNEQISPEGNNQKQLNPLRAFTRNSFTSILILSSMHRMQLSHYLFPS